MISPLRKKRFFAQKSIYELGVATGIQPSKISLVERGFAVASPEEKEKLARALGCELADIFPADENASS